MIHTREELERDGLDYVTITPASARYSELDCQYEVYGHGEYEDSSVLAGQYRRVCLAIYPTLEEAQRDYPWAEVQGGLLPLSQIAPGASVSPPGWFSPDDAGESWGEV